MKLLTFDIETIPQRQWVNVDRHLLDIFFEAESLEEGRVDRETATFQRMEVPHGFGDEQAPERGPFVMEAMRAGSMKVKSTGTVPACHATTCRVVAACFGWMDNDGKIITKAQTLTDFRSTKRQKPIQRWREAELDEAEDALLGRCLQAINKIHSDSGRLITFNGKSFDLPIVRWRAAMLGRSAIVVNRGTGKEQKPISTSLHGMIPWSRLCYPYDHKQHVDLRLMFSDGSKFAKGTLEMWCKAFGVPVKVAGHGSEVWERLHGVRGWKWLHKYALEEAQVLLDLYDKVERYA